MPDRSTRYEYIGGAAWHRDDSELTEDKEASKPKSKDRRTWNQYRGYGQVITRAGVAPDPVTQSATFYLRGMDGDVKKDGTKRAVTLTDSTDQTLVDADHHAGFAYETQTFTGDGGTIAAKSLNTPYASAVTATHTRARGLPALTARRHRHGEDPQPQPPRRRHMARDLQDHHVRNRTRPPRRGVGPGRRPARVLHQDHLRAQHHRVDHRQTHRNSLDPRRPRCHTRSL
ncbi:hypothetical protein [Embleya sp. NPDC050493]|uniref:hypothetical protein n=1 Tax=Embleya sp. NPDC050493 TaxID=3363989 RepID=UPI0037B38CA9